MNLLIITACPNGMVTSVLTSRLLEAAAHRLGWSTAVKSTIPRPSARRSRPNRLPRPTWSWW